MNEVDRSDDRQLRVFGFPVDPETLLPADRYCFGQECQGPQRLLQLARALASSPAWADMDGILIVRMEPPVGLAVVGRFSPAQVARLKSLPDLLQTQLSRFRYVSYQQAEKDCESLGEELIDRFGSEGVREFRYLAIPRGGLLVLGMLAYVLGLSRSSLGPPADDGKPLVLVDDVSISGLRFGQWVRERPEERIVFAHLYSHPSLREAIQEREDRVVDVLAARDLTDSAPSDMGSEYPAWRDRWIARGQNAAYWVGRPEHICFPWSEPDLSVWNPVTEQEEPGWRVAPPDYVLRNRFELHGGEGVQIQRPGTGRIRVTPGTYYGTMEDSVVVANTDTGKVVILDAVAGQIWRVVAGAGNVPEAARRIADQYDVSLDVARADADDLVQNLIARSYLFRESGSQR